MVRKLQVVSLKAKGLTLFGCADRIECVARRLHNGLLHSLRTCFFIFNIKFDSMLNCPQLLRQLQKFLILHQGCKMYRLIIASKNLKFGGFLLNLGHLGVTPQSIALAQKLIHEVVL